MSQMNQFFLLKIIQTSNKKVEKIKEIKDEIYKIFMQITTSNKLETNEKEKDKQINFKIWISIKYLI